MTLGYGYNSTGSCTLMLKASAVLLILRALGLTILGRYPEWCRATRFCLNVFIRCFIGSPSDGFAFVSVALG